MIVYTCQTPGYDAPRTDILNIPPMDIFWSDRLNAKMPKILPYLFLDDEVTVWCDASTYLTPDNLAAIEEKLKKADVVTLTHPNRDCIYSEADVCTDAGLDKAETIREQVNFYKGNGWPHNAGLYGCTVIARRHTVEIVAACNYWWAHITRWSSRDQISFPVVFANIRVETIPFESVEIRPHL